MFRYLVLVVVMGCASAAPVGGEQGPQGEQGIQGPRGQEGVPGPTGMQGAVGIQGPQGLQGIQGNVGPRGMDARRVGVFDGNGNFVGPYINNAVYVESLNCAMEIDFAKNVLQPKQVAVNFTGMDGGGAAFVGELSALPFWCIATANIGYRLQSPLIVRPFTAATGFAGLSQADQFGPMLPDGGSSVRVRNGNFDSAAGVLVDVYQFPTITGPFTFGLQ